MNTEPTTETTTTKPPEPRHVIVRLKTTNVQCIRAEGIEIVPNGKIISVTGKNAQGKSSLINSILWTLAGKKSIPERPIRDGASTATVEMDLGELKAVLRITASGGAKLRLNHKNGTPIDSPQTLLSSYSNPILLAPVEFVRLGETTEGRRKQADTLRQLLGLDFTAMDAERDRLYEARKLANRDVDTLKGKLASWPLDPDAPTEEVRVSDLMAALDKVQHEGESKLAMARAHNAANDKLKAEYDTVQTLVLDHQQTLADLDKEIRDLEELIKAKRQDRFKRQSDLDVTIIGLERARQATESLKYHDLKLVQDSILADQQPLRLRMSDADSLNAKVRSNRRHAELTSELTAAVTKANQLHASLDTLATERMTLLNEAQFPLPGLSLDETGILLNGIPLAQASTAQQLKAVVAIGFAMNPRIPVVLLRDAALLDLESRAEVAAMAEANDGQVWEEETTNGEPGEPGSIVIEDGAIKE